MAITHNTAVLRNMAGPERLLAICVKADGYGHGLVQSAAAALAGGADRLCVADLDEAVRLRKAGIRCPIHLLHPPTPDQAVDLVNNNLIPTLSSPRTALEMAGRLPGPLTVHVEVDTGMGRVDLKAADTPAFLDLLVADGRFRVEGLMSHFSSSHVPDDPASRDFTLEQLSRFRAVAAACRAAGHRLPVTHMASSGATVLYPEAYLGMIRPGYLIYGILRDWIDLPLEPALSWKARVLNVFNINSGQTVGYERTHTAPRDTTIAAVACGYGLGYPCGLSNRGRVLIHGQSAPVIGQVAMNQLMVDVGRIPGVKIGGEAVLIGRQGDQAISADEPAVTLKVSPAVITCGISLHVPRLYRSHPPVADRPSAGRRGRTA